MLVDFYYNGRTLIINTQHITYIEWSVGAGCIHLMDGCTIDLNVDKKTFQEFESRLKLNGR